MRCLSLISLLAVWSIAYSEYLEDEEANNTTQFSCNCGWLQRKRIVNGKETGINEFPFMAGLVNLKTNRTFCGATIITTRHAITAAHCVGHFDVRDTGLNVGDHDITTATETTNYVIPLQAEIPHQNYSSAKNWLDIALVVTSQNIPFSKNIGPVCLPSTQLFITHETVKVLGWGRVEHNGLQSNKLLEANLRVLSSTSCKYYYDRYLYPDSTNQFCTYNRNQDACQGDSGGPVLWRDSSSKRIILAGLVSYGMGCNIYPGVNTDVSSFIPWVKQQIRDTSNGISACYKIRN